MASKVQTFIGLFDYLRSSWGIKAKEVVKIIDAYPEFSLLNKKELMRRKIELIQKFTKAS